MARNHHRELFQVYVCGAIAYETRDENVAREYSRSARIGYNDSKVYVKTVYRDTQKTEY